jgi:hypothetical protein
MPTPIDYAAKKIAAALAGSLRKSATGPRTPEGKKRSALNALRHGLAGRTVVLPTEDLSAYLDYSRQMIESLRPETPAETELARTIADGFWRMRRFRTVEDGLFAWGHQSKDADFDADSPEIHAVFVDAATFEEKHKSFNTLSIYQQRIQRSVDKATHELRQQQAERKARHTAALREAAKLLQYNRMLAAQRLREGLEVEPEPDTLEHNEFVYSTISLDREIRRQTALEYIAKAA